MITPPEVRIVHEVRDFVGQHGCECLSAAEFAIAASVSERTLRAEFREYFGVGPVRYPKLRTLNLVRRTLQNTDAENE